MRMKLDQLVLKSVWAVVILLSAQFQVEAQRTCGTDELQQYYIDKDAALEQQLQQLRTDLLQNMDPKALKSAAQVTIPVVVHVIHEGEAVGTGTNLSDAQVLSQIDILNEDYRKLNADTSNTPGVFQPFAADVEIEFKLAVRDPDGNSTTGITREQGPQNGYTMLEFDQQVKPNTVWDRNNYLNIWTAKLTGASSGTLGYAIKPGNSADIDGVVIGYRYFGNTGNLQSPFDQGRTCTHEVGHWLGLDHLWGLGDPAVTDCVGDDGIADTPIQGKANYGCPSFPSTSCTNGPNGDMFMNYMDYVNDGCMNMFTEGQKTLMYNVLNGPRSSIRSSTAASLYELDLALLEVIHPSDTLCSTGLLPVIKIKNEGSTTVEQFFITYNLDNSNLNQVIWTGSLEAGDVIDIPVTELTLSPGDHSLEIYLSNPNGLTDQNSVNDLMTVDFYVDNSAPTANALPFMVNFNSFITFPPANWSVNNVDNDAAAWALTFTVSAYGANGSCVWLNLFDINTTGTVDHFVTAPIEVSDAGQHPVLSFNIAYAKQDVGSSDQLNVYYSLDCGHTWTQGFSKSGDDLKTTTDRVGAFIPGEDDWSTEYMITEGIAGQKNVMYKFEVVSGGGNNIYIDNINIETWNVGVEDIATVMDLNMYPNPTHGKVRVNSTTENITWTGLSIYNLSGKQVFLQTLNSQVLDMNVDVTDLSSGLYIVKLDSDKGAVYRKLMVR